MSVHTFRNTDHHRRVWLHLTHPDGHTLALEPGEKVDLDLPAAFEDPFLQRVDGASRPQRRPPARRRAAAKRAPRETAAPLPDATTEDAPAAPPISAPPDHEES